jgi:pSer/pThr/pTyr-binding forkhead associated (FHA) protein
LAVLEIITETQLRRLQLGDAPANIGRCKTNTIALNDEKVSRAHCVVELTPRGYQVRDLASLNGTFHDGQKIDAWLLGDADEFQIGFTRFRFRAE